LDNELYLKENPSAEKPSKKARGGVASRKAKANSIAAHAARSKGKLENQPPSSTIDEESNSHPSPSKAGDLSFVLNGPPGSPPASTSKSPNVQPVKQTSTLSDSGPLPGFTPAEPSHNRIVLNF
jgi:hypothetical protein